MGGEYAAKNFKYLRINFYRCDNKTNRNPNIVCKPKEIIDEALN